jgi:ATP-dependent DNA helicase HFM1/MER3
MVERKLVFERLNRLVRAVIDCKGYDRDSIGTKTALELARSLAAESWEGRATQLTQVPNIGPVGMRKLASKDIRTVLELADKEYDEIERLMSRQPPFGRTLQAHLDKFPRLQVEAAVVGHRVQPRSEEPVVIEVKATLRYLNRKGLPNWLNRVPTLTFLAETNNGTLVYFWRGSMRKLENQAGFDLKFSVGLRNVKEHVICHLSCEEIVGTIVSKTLEHKVPASAFPARPVQPQFSQRSQPDNHEYLDNDDLDDSDLILVAERALTQPSTKPHSNATTQQDPEEYPCVEELVEPRNTEKELAATFDDQMADHDEEGMDATTREPVRLPNGRWQCNHPCSGGAPTKSGKPCNHRCCKEGLEKPRRQRPKRKREESALDTVDAAPSKIPLTRPQQDSQARSNDQAASQAKRQKVHGASSWTQSTLDRPMSGSRFTPVNRPKPADLDTMDLECIDLSFTDDEADDIFKSLGAAPSGRKGSDTFPDAASTDATNSEERRLEGTTAASTHAISSKDTPARKDICTKSAAHPSAQDFGSQDDYFGDDDDFSIVETLPTVTPTSTAGPFRSGASDGVLYQGISNKFFTTGTNSSPGTDAHGSTSNLPSRVEEQHGNPSSSLFVNNAPGMSPDKSPQSSATAEQVVSPTTSAKTEGETAAGTLREESRTGGVKESDEPAWVAEFDPEFVDMFRGYVTFV